METRLRKCLIFSILLISNAVSASIDCNRLVSDFFYSINDSFAISESIQIIKNQEALFEKTFSRSSGYKSFKFYNKLITENIDSELSKSIETIQNEQFVVAMHTPSSARLDIIESGEFLNQHYMNASSGKLANNPRLVHESSLMGMKYAEYRQLNNTIKPKYMAIHASPDLGFRNSTSTHSFGNDKFIFNFSKLKNRMTWHPGDSWDNFFKEHSEVNKEGLDSYTPKSWDQLFIPWKFKDLLIPLMHENIKNQSIGLDTIVSNSSFHKTFKGLKLGHQKGRYFAPFTEVQLWGPLSLDHVTGFVFENNPPSGEFLYELIRRGIKIYDGTSIIRETPWVPTHPVQ